MKKLYIFLSIIGLISVLNQNVLAQVPFGGYISTVGTADYPTHLDNLGKGGYRSVLDKAERDLITTERRKPGMLVYVTSLDLMYILKSVTPDLNSNAEPADWFPLSFGTSTGGGSVIYSGTGTPTANPPANSKDGDYYFDKSGSTFYGPRTTIANVVDWGTGTPLSGAAGTNGNTVLNGQKIPDDVNDGVDGDFYIETSTNTIYGPKLAGAWPATGTVLKGINGNTVLNGQKTPDDVNDGVDGDFYIETSTNTIYGPKLAGAWSKGTSLIGPVGLNGINGNTVLNGTGDPSVNNPGVTGDFYIDTQANTIYGPKGATIWPLTGTILKGTNGIGVDFKGSFAAAPANPTINQAYYDTVKGQSFIFDGTAWQLFAQDGASGIFNAAAASTSPIVGLSGVTLGTANSTISQVLQALIYPSLPAGASLTITNNGVSPVLEVAPSGTFTLSWVVTPSATPNTPINSITVNGVSQPTSPLSGTVNINPNPSVAGTTNYSMSVTTDKTTNANASISFQFRRFWARCAGPTPTDLEILAAKNASAGGGTDLVGSNINNNFKITYNGTPSYFFFAYPTNFAPLSSFIIGSAESYPAFTKELNRSITTNGVQKNYNVYTSPNAYTADTPLLYTK